MFDIIQERQGYMVKNAGRQKASKLETLNMNSAKQTMDTMNMYY